MNHVANRRHTGKFYRKRKCRKAKLAKLSKHSFSLFFTQNSVCLLHKTDVVLQLVKIKPSSFLCLSFRSFTRHQYFCEKQEVLIFFCALDSLIFTYNVAHTCTYANMYILSILKYRRGFWKFDIFRKSSTLSHWDNRNKFSTSQISAFRPRAALSCLWF